MMIQQYEKAKVIQDEQLERLTQICQEQGVKFSYVFIYTYLVKANQTVHVLCCKLSFEKYHWALCCGVTGLSAKEALAATSIFVSMVFVKQQSAASAAGLVFSEVRKTNVSNRK